MSVWLVEMGRERGRKEREEEGKRHRERVQAFLEAAASSTVAAPRQEEEEEEEGGEREAVMPAKTAVKEERRSVSGKRTPQPSIWQTARKHVVSTP